jgi:hypothetical protein
MIEITVLPDDFINGIGVRISIDAGTLFRKHAATHCAMITIGVGVATTHPPVAVCAIIEII